MKTLFLGVCMLLGSLLIAEEAHAQFQLNNLSPCAHKVRLVFMDGSCTNVSAQVVSVQPFTLLNVNYPAGAVAVRTARVDSGVPGGQGLCHASCFGATSNTINGCNGLTTYIDMAPAGDAMEIVQ